MLRIAVFTAVIIFRVLLVQTIRVLYAPVYYLDK